MSAPANLTLSSTFFETNPQVSASIQEYGSQKIFVVGEVRNPGSYPLSGETTLLAALALAGSTLPTAGDTIIINRPKAAPPAAPDSLLLLFHLFQYSPS